jgi:L-amino acid N-acyltransferase YncA
MSRRALVFWSTPALRHRGYGWLIIQRLMVQPQAVSAKEWKVGIEASNIASRKCLASVDFVPENEVADEKVSCNTSTFKDRRHCKNTSTATGILRSSV